METIILASSSKYRKRLLSRLLTRFDCQAPNIDESIKEGEAVDKLVMRLTLTKANAIAKSNSDAWVIGSDQVAVHNQTVLGKPGNFENAQKQLSSFSGETVNFITGVCLINLAKNIELYDYDITRVYFKTLSASLIDSYLKQDEPFDCAGSFKVESKGPLLFERVENDDPTALEGLPLIKLSKLFARANIDVLSQI